MHPCKIECNMTPKEISDLFSNLETILVVNTELSNDMEKRIKDGEGIGQSFTLLVIRSRYEITV